MVLMAAVLSDLHVVFNQAQERLSWEQRSWFRTRRVMVAFSEVRDVFVLESVSRNNDDRVGGYAAMYRCMLRTTRETLPLSTSEGADKADSQALCDAVQAIVMRDAKAPDAQTQVERTIRAGRLVDAVAMIREHRGVSLAEARRIAEDMRARNEDSRPRRPT